MTVIDSSLQTPSSWHALTRFIAREDGDEYVGEPVDLTIDISKTVSSGKAVLVRISNAKSILDENIRITDNVKTIKSISTPLKPSEIGTIRCIGVNYKKHAAEMNLPLPKTPTILTKPSTTLISSLSPIILPNSAPLPDYEVELAIVQGRDCKNVTPDTAMDYIIGYIVANDVTSRYVQEQTSQWEYSKGFDTFCPVGPVIVEKSNVNDLREVVLRTELNGVVMQEQKAEDMIFSVGEIVAHLSKGMTLSKGTVILSGTPSGIGHGRTPQLYLKEGDELRVSISHVLGTLLNPITADKTE